MGDVKPTNLPAQGKEAMGMQVSEASADYSADNGEHITLEVSDTGGAKGLMSLAASMAPEEEKQTEHGYEKTYSSDGNLIHEAWDTHSNSGEYNVVVGPRCKVKANCEYDSIDTLKKAHGSIDLGKMKSRKDPGVNTN